ncbi:hypothetical protein [Pseudoxanthomonas sp. UC19_8]|uniref:hypothetical protein n=1 Tax=Pseudoxanthomonas sp. UC19_8 TaxID=3350175 RepID=UPI0036D2B75D
MAYTCSDEVIAPGPSYYCSLEECPGVVEYPVRPRYDASVAWMNLRWLSDNGYRVDSADAKEHVAKRLLRSFAYDLDGRTRFSTSSKVIGYERCFVDGYGTTSLARYGGSGRAGVLNGMQVKGIGRTLFADADADWDHGHGYVWLEEGLREAVFSEVCRREAPCSAVPVVAVIALEETVTAPSGERFQRALLVRPFFVRPAHLQRSLLLERHDCRRMSTHLLDVDRVRWHIDQWNHRSGDVRRAFPALAHAYGRQSAYAHCYGWFNGGFTSSNLTLEGKFIDFGGARFVADCCSRAYDSLGLRFGDELATSVAVLSNLALLLSKYAGFDLSQMELTEYLLSGYERGLAENTSRLLGAIHLQSGDNYELHALKDGLARARAKKQASHSYEAEEAAIARYAVWLGKQGACDPASAMKRWRAIRYREGASREAIQHEAAAAAAQERECIQNWVDGLIERLCLPVNAVQKDDRWSPPGTGD